jgi:hypothetical protein
MASDPVASLLRTLSVELEEHKGLALENHLYGCLSIWEQWAEGVLEIKGGVVNGEGEEDALDLQNAEDWAAVGQAFGFTEDAPLYTGSEAYQALWRSVFLHPVEWRSLGRVDAVEEPLFDRLEALGAVYMQAALATGELPRGWTPPVEHTIVVEEVDGAEEEKKQTEQTEQTETGGAPRVPPVDGRRKYKHTRRTHGRRSLSPVHHHNRRFGVTRRRKHN